MLGQRQCAWRPPVALPTIALAFTLTIALAVPAPAFAAQIEWGGVVIGWPGQALATDGTGATYVASIRDGDLHVASNKTGQWVDTAVVPFPDSHSLKLTIDGGGSVHVYAKQLTSGSLYATNRTGVWVVRRLDLIPTSPSEVVVRMEADPLGGVHVLAIVPGSTDFYYATNRRGYWITTKLGTTTRGVDLAVDHQSRAHIVTGGKYLTNATGSWVATAMPFSASVSADPAVEAAAGTIRVVGAHSGGTELLVLASGTWTKSIITTKATSVDIETDAAGYNHILARRTSGAIDYLTDRSGSWVTRPGVTWASVHGFDVTSTGKPMIVAGSAIVSQASTGWARRAVVGGQALRPDVARGADGGLRVLYQWPGGVGGGTPGTTLATLDGSTWTHSNISTAAAVAQSLAIDSAGGYHVVIAAAIELLYVTDESGVMVTTVIDSTDGVDCTTIALGPDGAAYVLYRRPDVGYSYPRFYVLTNRSGSWVRTLMPSQAAPASGTEVGPGCGDLAIDAAGRAHVVYSAGERVRYVNDVATLGTFAVTQSFIGWESPAIAVDSAAKAHIGMVDRTSPAGMTYVTNDTGTWLFREVVGAAGTPSIEMAADGPVMAWATGELHVARASENWLPRVLTARKVFEAALSTGPGGSIDVVYRETSYPDSAVYLFWR